MKSYDIAKGFDDFVPGVDVPPEILAKWKAIKTDVTDKAQQKETYDQANYDFFQPFITELKKEKSLSWNTLHGSSLYQNLPEINRHY